MEDKVIDELNAVLKGAIMAVDAYEGFIQNTKDRKLKREFQQIQQDHRRHIGEISQRIKTLGGEPSHKKWLT